MVFGSVSSSSDSESESEGIARLGECEVCGKNKAKYTCPRCEVKTCCLDCVRIHKAELECNGIRDRTKFVRIKDFTDTDLLSDYRLLEECARFVYAVKRDEKKKFTRIDKDLPIHLYKLKLAARKRGIVLQFLARNFTRNQVNTTKYEFKKHIINWRIEWMFPNVEGIPLKFVDEKCPENTKLSDLLDKYLNPDGVPFEGSKALAFYRSAGLSGVKVLLKAEKVKGSQKKFFELDPAESVCENLSGKCIIEFPIIFVVLKDHAYNFEIITPEDEFDYDKSEPTEANVQESQSNVITDSKPESSKNGYKKRLLLTEKIAQEKKEEIEKEIKEQRKKKPKNLLFTTGYSSEESIHTDSDGET
ncbi:unnamed protein product [Colias eurytheme]|nr:unnamed protein product [Colias eurytheme]